MPRPAGAMPILLALLAVYVIWGSTYLAIAVMIETLPPLVASGVRFLVAGALLLGWCLWRGRLRGAWPTAAQWRAATIVGALLLLGGNGLVVLAELRIPSGITALLIATVPLWLALLEALRRGGPPSPLAAGGLLAGLMGVAILVLPSEGIPAIDLLGVGLVVVAAVCWASGTLVARDAGLPPDRLVATSLEMLTGGALLLAFGAATGGLAAIELEAFSLRSLVALAYLIVFGSLVAFTAYIWLLGHASTSVVATYAYVNPVVAVALGWLLLSEEITLRTLVASLVIVGAVAAMVSGRPARESAAASAPRRPAPALRTDSPDA